MNRTKKIILYAGLFMLLSIVAVGGFYGYVYWQLTSGRLIYFKGELYTKEQVSKLVGPQVYEVASKNTPEEVYARFREALLKNDIEAALAEMRPEKREEYRTAIQADKAKYEQWVKSLPEKITKEEELGNYSYYDVKYGSSNKNTATFIKNQEGYWQIDII
ncbi:MAG: hypothetical protein WCK11_04680 [Candidatus Falkowbacteria bacterium]